MAETAVSLARQHVLPLFMEVANMEDADIKDELESIQAFIDDADKVAEAEKDNRHRRGIKKKVKQLRESTICLEDIVDEYMIHRENQPDGLGYAALPCRAVNLGKTLFRRLQIAYKFQGVKSLVRGIEESIPSQSSLEHRPESSRENQNATCHNLRMAPLYTKEAEVVGFEEPRDELINWLTEERTERTVISVLGMGGLGKTTLAKRVFDSKEVVAHFKCRVWIRVTQSYTVEGLLMDMLHKFYGDKTEDLPCNVSSTSEDWSIDEVKEYSHHLRDKMKMEDIVSSISKDEFMDEMRKYLNHKSDKMKMEDIVSSMSKDRFMDEMRKYLNHKSDKMKMEDIVSSTSEDRFMGMRKYLNHKRDKMKDSVSSMGTDQLIAEVRKYLNSKRYVVVFDDVWSEKFWQDIQFPLIDNDNGSRILITTRNTDVALFCKRSCLVHEHVLQPLSEENSLELFHKMAFHNLDGRCPSELEDVSHRIVRMCSGIPLAIVVIGGLLSGKDKSTPEWNLFGENLRVQLKRDSELASITIILSLSYDDLPYNLRLCLLYFGMYPQNHEVKSNRLIRQWIAEGFVKPEEGKTLEEVAHQYLIELIRRSLVQVSSFTIDGKVKVCRVHDLIHAMILRKIEDTGFCHYVGEWGQSMSSGIVRRLIVSSGILGPLEIATGSNDLTGSIESSHIWSILFFTKEELSEHSIIRRILAKYMPLKVLDFEDTPLSHVPENFGNLIHLKYLSFRKTRVGSLPKSIGKLQNLETLDVRQTLVSEMPKEISMLKKLRHLLTNNVSWDQLKDSLGGMTSLQKIHALRIDDHRKVIKELGKLKQLRALSLVNFREAHGNTLCSSINEMQCLEKLYIYTKNEDEAIDLNFSTSSLSTLRKLFVSGRLRQLPKWIPKLKNLVKLSLMCSKLTNDPLESLKKMPCLLFLSITRRAYEGETLHFQSGGFQNLKELQLIDLDNLKSITIDEGALLSLETLELTDLPRLSEVPRGIQYLRKLQVLKFWFMPNEFDQSIVSMGGENHWIMQRALLGLMNPKTLQIKGVSPIEYEN